MNISVISLLFEMMKYKVTGTIVFVISLLVLIALDPSSNIPARTSVIVNIGYVMVVPLYSVSELKYPGALERSFRLHNSVSELKYPVKQLKTNLEQPQRIEDRLKETYSGLSFRSTTSPDRITIAATGKNIHDLELRVMNVAHEVVAEHGLKVERLREVHKYL